MVWIKAAIILLMKITLHAMPACLRISENTLA